MLTKSKDVSAVVSERKKAIKRFNQLEGQLAIGNVTKPT